MFRRHIDFVAVFFIAIALLAFSSLASLRLPDVRDSIRLQNAIVNIDSCPTTREVLTRLGLFN
jgi:hypothetical protein